MLVHVIGFNQLEARLLDYVIPEKDCLRLRTEVLDVAEAASVVDFLE